MTVRVDKKVWDVAAREAAEHEDWAISLLLRSAQGVERLEGGLNDTLANIVAAYRAEVDVAADADDIPFPGSWGTTRVAAGLLLVIAKSESFDSFDTLVRDIAAGLESRDISGTISVWTKPPGVRAPSIAPMICCRVRVRGSREHPFAGRYRWQPDNAARGAVVAAADAWTRAMGGALRSVTLGLIGPIDLAPGEDAVSRLLETVPPEPFAQLVAATADRFRGVGVEVTGGVSLVAGGGHIEQDGWRAEVDEMTAFLRDQADNIAYAYIRPGWQILDGMVGQVLNIDWPRREASRPWGPGTMVAFEDMYAPDAFGVQLLGPGYEGRPGTVDGWTSESLGNSTLVSHNDPAAWFAQPFIPCPPPPDVTVPRVLTQARDDLAAILYSPGVLVDAGFSDVTAE